MEVTGTKEEDLQNVTKIYTLRQDDYDPEDPDILQEKIKCKVELEYDYGSIVRISSSERNKKETKVWIDDYDSKVVRVSSNSIEKDWVLEALDTCGFSIVDDEGDPVEV